MYRCVCMCTGVCAYAQRFVCVCMHVCVHVYRCVYMRRGLYVCACVCSLSDPDWSSRSKLLDALCCWRWVIWRDLREILMDFRIACRQKQRAAAMYDFIKKAGSRRWWCVGGRVGETMGEGG